jgi:hypothetical protein
MCRLAERSRPLLAESLLKCRNVALRRLHREVSATKDAALQQFLLQNGRTDASLHNCMNFTHMTGKPRMCRSRGLVAFGATSRHTDRPSGKLPYLVTDTHNLPRWQHRGPEPIYVHNPPRSNQPRPSPLIRTRHAVTRHAPSLIRTRRAPVRYSASASPTTRHACDFKPPPAAPAPH